MNKIINYITNTLVEGKLSEPAFYYAYINLQKNPEHQEDIIIELIKYLKLENSSLKSHIEDHWKVCSFQKIIVNTYE